MFGILSTLQTQIERSSVSAAQFSGLPGAVWNSHISNAIREFFANPSVIWNKWKSLSCENCELNWFADVVIHTKAYLKWKVCRKEHEYSKGK